MAKVEKHLKTGNHAQSEAPVAEGVPVAMPLLATKLHQPHLPTHFLPRQRLLNGLEEGRGLPLVLVSAPAGYGKSTLVAEWLEKSDRPVAWLSLDSGDSDLSVFLRYVVTAIDAVFPGACALTKSALAAPELRPAKVLAAQLANELDAIEASFTLVLDDYHLIEDTAIHDLIGELLRYPAADVHLVIVTRRDPPLPLASLRAKGRLAEIRFDDLQFSSGEAGALMEDLLGSALSDAAMKRLMELSEGWVAGLQLVALAARHQPDPEEFLFNLEGSLRNVRDYLLSEVLAQQPAKLRECLLKTSVVNRFSGSFCEGVCENRDGCPLAGESMMRTLAQTGIFTVPLDAEGKWFRYHHLFQDLLQSQLEREVGVDGVAALHARASRWCESFGSIDEAIDHALEAGDPVRAAELTEKHLIAEFNVDRWFVVKNWLRKIPDEVKAGRPAILLAQAWITPKKLRQSEIAALVAQAESCLTEVGEDEREGLMGQINLHKAMLRFWQGDAAGVLEFVGKAERQLPAEAVFARAGLQDFWGVAHQMIGQGEQALEELERKIRDESESHPLLVTRWLAATCTLRILACQPAAAQQAAMRIRDVAERNGLPNTVVWASFYQGVPCFQSGEFEAARSHYREVAEKRHFFHRQAALLGIAGLALSCEAMGRHDEADEALDLLQEFAREGGEAASLALADSCRARVALWRGELSTAVRLLPPQQGTPDPADMSYFVEVPCLTHCRVLLAKGAKDEVAAAAKTLAALRKGLEGLHNTFQLIDVLVLQAWALQLMGMSGKAKATLEEALQLAEPGWWIRPFLEAGEVVMALMDSTESDRSPFRTELRNRLLERQPTGENQAGDPPAKSAPKQPLIEPLTNRELDVLELIGQRLYNKEIADRLSISPGTVKAHLKHIYQKLDVGNRRAAVDRARELRIF
ncbi:MAG: LuxR family maltose regulon positive regulatory protein [Hyphomicrobiaceae bacterium]|jgi:LuxR family maltose regulon positive regulatory protein